MSDGDVIYWLSIFIGVQAICMAGLVWAVEHMKNHIDLSSPTAALVILTLCGATSVLIAVMLSPVVWYYASREAGSLHRTETQDES